MPAAAGPRRTLNTLLTPVGLAIVTCLALCTLLLGRGLFVEVAGAQAATTVPDATVPPETTTSAVTTTTQEPAPTTTVDTTVPVEEQTSSDEATTEEEVESTTTTEEEVEESVTTTSHRSTTTVAPTTTKAPASSTTTSAAVPSSAASSNGGATAGSGSTTSGDDSQDVLRLVMATLVVVGLLIGLLTWRYWRYSDPRRGLAPARARVPVSRPPVSHDDVDGTVAQPPFDEQTELVPSVSAAQTAAWPVVEHGQVPLRRNPGPFDHTVVVTDDPTDPGGWTVPDRQPVGSE